jgi:hypothetical protein
VAAERLALQQRVLDVVEELDAQRQRPPPALLLAGEPGRSAHSASSITSA